MWLSSLWMGHRHRGLTTSLKESREVTATARLATPGLTAAHATAAKFLPGCGSGAPARPDVKAPRDHRTRPREPQGGQVHTPWGRSGKATLRDAGPGPRAPRRVPAPRTLDATLADRSAAVRRRRRRLYPPSDRAAATQAHLALFPAAAGRRQPGPERRLPVATTAQTLTQASYSWGLKSAAASWAQDFDRLRLLVPKNQSERAWRVGLSRGGRGGAPASRAC